MADFFEVDAMVRGYHQYREIWEAEVGEQLECRRENSNPHDIFAVAVLKSRVVVGHVPKKISSVCSLFLRHGGVIRCRVTGNRCYSADLVQGGLEIPCLLKFEANSEKLLGLLDKAQKLVASALKSGAKSADEVNCREESELPVELLNEVPESKKPTKCGESLTNWQMDIQNGAKLSDIPINIAQRLLKEQFPNFNGLQLTLCQQKHQMVDVITENQMQVIHCRGDHWIVASSVGCIEGTVNIYDSSYTVLHLISPLKCWLAVYFMLVPTCKCNLCKSKLVG